MELNLNPDEKFRTSHIAQMKPGDSFNLLGLSAKEVQSIRTLCNQYKRLNCPEGIERYSIKSLPDGGNTYTVHIIAIAS